MRPQGQPTIEGPAAARPRSLRAFRTSSSSLRKVRRIAREGRCGCRIIRTPRRRHSSSSGLSRYENQVLVNNYLAIATHEHGCQHLLPRQSPRHSSQERSCARATSRWRAYPAQPWRASSLTARSYDPHAQSRSPAGHLKRAGAGNALAASDVRRAMPDQKRTQPAAR